MTTWVSCVLNQPARARRATWIVLIAMLLASAGIGRLLLRDQTREASERFDDRVAALTGAVEERMHAYELVLRGGAALFKVAPGIERDDWHTFVSDLDLQHNYPGIQAVAYAEHIASASLATHEQQMRAQGTPDYAVRPAGAREDYTAIVFVEPQSASNRDAIGYDMFSEPVRRAAMERARDLGEISLSGKVRLIQDAYSQSAPAGVLMYLAVYRPGAPIATEAQKRAALLGYVCAPFRMNDLMHGIVGANEADVDFEIYDGYDITPVALMYRESALRQRYGNDYKPAFEQSAQLMVEGRPWTLVLRSPPYSAAVADLPLAVLLAIASLIISLLFFAVIRTLVVLRERAMTLAGELSRTARESEQRLRTLTDSMPALISYISTDGRYRFNNRTYEEWFGRPAASFFGRTPRELWGDEHGDFLEPKIARCLAGEQLEFEGQVGTPPRKLRTMYVPDRRDDGRIVGLYILSHDISELDAVKRRLQDITDNAPALIGHFDTNGRYDFANRTYENWFGTPTAKLIGRTPAEALGAHIGESTTPAIAAALAGEVQRIEVQVGTPPRTVQAVYMPDRREDGAIVGVYVLANDVSDFKRVQRELVAAQRRLQDITDHLPALVAYVDRDFRYRFANGTYAEWYGRVPELGSHVRELIGDAAFALLQPQFSRCLMGEEVTSEFEFEPPDCARRYVQARFAPDRDDTGKIRGIYVLVNDFTERKATEDRLLETERRLRDIADNLPALIAYVDDEERYRFFNATYGEWFEAERIPGIGMSMAETLPAAVYEQIAPLVRSCLAGETVAYDTDIPLRDGGVAHAHVDYTPDFDENGSVRGFYVLVTDLTERKEMEEALFDAKERAQVTLQSIGDAVVTTDIEGRVSYLNPTAERMSGWMLDDARGRPIEWVLSLLDGTRSRAVNPLRTAIAEDRALDVATQLSLVRLDGRELAVESSAAPIHDRKGDVVGGVMVLHDVSDARAMALKMSHLAQHDTLTGLPNRALLSDRLAQAIALAERNTRRCALLFVDLDHFKHVNDSLGHAVGDQLLSEIARRLNASVRRSDTVSRQGGDEFVLLLPEVDSREDVARIAHKLLEVGNEPCVIDGHELHFSFSIGISVFPEDGRDADALMMHADAAMYHAKRSGRNNFQFFSAEFENGAGARMSIETGLRHALKNGELRLHFQPKIDQATGELTGAEALVRWQRRPDELLHPADFIAIAEDSRLILQIDEWVLRETCRQNVEWQAAGLPAIPISVNVAASHFDSTALVHLVAEVLRETRLNPRYLEIEITESAVMKDTGRTQLMLSALKDMGVRIAIDDFGTGYSSLSYLCRFPFDAIKIDQSFVRHITSVKDNAAITAAIISMAKQLRHRTVAEGVETEEQADLLRAQGCDEFQGFLFGRPMPADAFAEILAAPRQATIDLLNAFAAKTRI